MRRCPACQTEYYIKDGHHCAGRSIPPAQPPVGYFVSTGYLCCGYSFSTPAALSAHQATHQLGCYDCARSFTSPRRRDNHIRARHLPRQFINPTALYDHLRIQHDVQNYLSHLGSYICPFNSSILCTTSVYFSLAALGSHIESHHFRQNECYCPFCA